MALGSSFSVTPAGLEEQAQRAKKRLPTQQALQTISMQLPKVLGAEGLAPSSRTQGAYTPGDKFAAGGGDQTASQMARMMRKMSGYKAGATKPTGPRFSQGTTGTTTAPKAAAPMAPKPMAPKPPMSMRPPSRDDGPGGPEAPEPGDPGYIGGGYVDSMPNPPAQMAPPAQQAPAPSSPPPGSGAYDTNDPYGPGGAPAGTSGYYDNQGNYHPMGNYQTNRAPSGQVSRGY